MNMPNTLQLAELAQQSENELPADSEQLRQILRTEALALWAREPFLRSTLERHILEPESLAAMVLSLVAQRLAGIIAPGNHSTSTDTSASHFDLHALLQQALNDHQAEFEADCCADLVAIKSRDPACPSYLHGLMNLKGFHTLVVHRAASKLWHAGRSEMALWLSNAASLVFGADIHPGASMGHGIMLDHASGIVIGETSVVENDVSILQNVTLGGTGKERGDRHPKIRAGVMIGAGAKILGNIEIGINSKVAAGSVVLKAVPAHCTVAGVPAKVVRQLKCTTCPATEMNQEL